MNDVAKLKAEWEKLDKDLMALGEEYDKKLNAVKDQYRPKLEEANKKAVAAQKAYCDADALNALVDREDGATVALGFIESGTFTREQVEQAGIDLP